MGGTHGCGEEKIMDGQKYVCMDLPLSLPTPGGASRDPSHCLTLSFGVHLDTTFDDAVSEFPCEVHMFDVMPFYPNLANQVPHVYFHQVGLAAFQHKLFYNKINRTADVNSLSGHVNNLSLHSRLIHVLKIDIDGGEWDVLKNLAEDPLLDAVGQVAMEVHVVNLVMSEENWTTRPPSQVSRENWLRELQDRYQILRLFESRGFRRVFYWDNIQDKYALYEKNGTRHETAGEVLYVNTNWYRESFRSLLRTRDGTTTTTNKYIYSLIQTALKSVPP
ncbi:hypothetical protein Pmani_012625 [Petrolisthes manimaculis]|uniref:Methyltransferase domain-containing protein n=1 Tax=Petrolisthes manimaculis TaxID=1843537 RepID=A0AAE1UCY4_9EUCA|nr:hypothetical protein Pmani_012625 [Petrolisthes manimaculis]